MTTFTQFAARCKMRHDFADRIQVRYHHPDGESYDTWVSGEEVERRLRSEQAEARLRGLGRLSWDEIREAARELPDKGKDHLRDRLHDQFADSVEDFLGDNPLAAGLGSALRSGETGAPPDPDKARWQARLQDDPFRLQVLALAWINLRGSFPEGDDEAALDDWV